MAFKVFVSHSMADLGLIYQLKYWLELNGVETYLDELYPKPGISLGSKITSAIEQSDCVIALISRDGGRSKWVNQEIGYAWAKGRLVIPIVEKGEPLVGFPEGREYISFDRSNPADAINKAIDYLARMKANKEAQEKALAGLIIFFGLMALVAAAASKK